MKLFSFLFLVSLFAQGAIPEKLIQNNIGKKLDEISTLESWQDFLSKNEKLFPKISKEKSDTHVVVQKEVLNVEGDSYTLGVGYRQTFIKAPIARVKKVLNSPELFRSLYGLDADAAVKPQSKSGEDIKEFKARIYKQVPLIPNQDYVLSYHNGELGSLWVQRAKLDKDNEHFALRDNLKILEPVNGGTILREVSIIYALKWYVRFFGPSVRDVMSKELAKITNAAKCLSETSKDLTNEAASECWKVASAAK